MSDVSAVNDFNAQIIEEFRENAGKVLGMFERATLLLLHHKGAKSGVERISPLAYRREGDAYAVFGSLPGARPTPRSMRSGNSPANIEKVSATFSGE